MEVKSRDISWVNETYGRDSWKPRAGMAASPVGTRNNTDPNNVFTAVLSGFNQVPPVLTNGTGSFEARVRPDGTAIDYTLTFSNLSSPSVVAHIHFGHPTDNGDIIAFLCGGGGKPMCPGRGGTVTGTITAADILAIPSQGLAAGDLSGALRIIRAGLAYANVHTQTHPGGEIRGQLRRPNWE